MARRHWLRVAGVEFSAEMIGLNVSLQDVLASFEEVIAGLICL